MRWETVTFPVRDGRRKYTVVPLVNHLGILTLSEGLNNVMLNTNTYSPPQCESPTFFYLFPCLPVSSSSEWPSATANLAQNENYLNILGELRESCATLRAPFHLPCFYGSTLSYYVSCLCSPDRRGRMKLKLVPGIYVRVCTWKRMRFKRIDTLTQGCTAQTHRFN